MTVMASLLRTPLHSLHLELEATMVPFAGYEMPLHFRAGILKEHLHTRSGASLFDVSHMGQVRLKGQRALAALETLMPIDIVNLAPGTQRYGMFTNDQGGILDDVIVGNCGDSASIVVNATCKEADIAHLQALVSDQCKVEALYGQALLALQGPAAAAVLSRHVPEAASMKFMGHRECRFGTVGCSISRSGYTGEDGYEISIAANEAENLARTLLAEPEVAAAGLGARDSLRIEAGLCLYGHDITSETTPVEASLTWALSKARRKDGKRPGGYPGDKIIFDQLSNGVSRQRVGLLSRERTPVREGAELLNESGNAVGRVTSGTFGPSHGAPVAMGYVASPYAASGTQLRASVRNRLVSVEVAQMPFVSHRYYRA